MSGVRLDALVAATRERLAERRRELPAAELERRAAAAPPPRGLRAALAGPGVAVIAEHKRRSPSAGVIRAEAALPDIVGAFARGGAAALSILTERDHFGGDLADLDQARQLCPLPILRKDFTVDPYQLLEARAHQADAVLLVVGALAPDALERLQAEARSLGLDALVEVHDERELDVALAARAELIGINNRDLADFSVDLERTFELFDAIPAGTTVVSESGIHAAADVARLGALGVHAVLVGEALMRAADPEAACRALASAAEAPA